MINWSKDSNKRSIQVQTVVQMLGFEIPKNEEQMKLWDKAFEGYPYELNIDMIDLDKIWNDEAQDFDSVLHPIISTNEESGVCPTVKCECGAICQIVRPGKYQCPKCE